MEATDNSSESTVTNGSERVPGMVNWGTATVVAMFAGMLYGGSREASSSVSKDAEVMLKLGSIEDKRAQYRLMRDAMEKRIIRVTERALVGGVRLGMFTAAFYFPLGWIHLKMVEIANEGNSEAHSDQREVKSGVSAAIERLEGNLRK
ncbi:unnamed protein product [Vicia faba]|uniref:Complex I assembly factor TIMMDC1, mitochondrial n=1 Tax=Vicia faba TaxID=3906 RepID=A0AAV1AKF5_VICFA|nr:unnamed protein product [Vicia faba]